MCLPRLGIPETRSAFGALRYHLICALALLAFGSATPAAAADGSSRFERLRQQENRVAGVAYALATANRQRCREALVPRAGFVLHDLAQYGIDDRQDAAHAYGLGSLIGVMAVVPESPAAKAGLRPGDQVEAVNGRALTSASGAAPTNAFVERAGRIVREEMDKGGITLRVRTAGAKRDVRFTAETGCAAEVQLIPGTGVNAWADGERVMVSGAIVAQCATDDDLALVIAHELAHNLLHHRKRLAAAGISGAGPQPTSTAGLTIVRDSEEEADRFAVRLASTAGYDLSGSAVFLGRLLEANGLSARAAATHPGAGRRLALLKVAIIQTKAAASVVL